ncbi:N-acetyltransferase family protein [Endozoicomonadaceae bacterium StTr2]
MITRSATVDDAPAMLDLFRDLDSETQFMLYEPGERTTTLEQQQEIIQDFIESPFKTMLVAVDESSNEIAGFTVGIGNTKARNRHSVYCVIGLRQQYTGQGVGKQLIDKLENWSRERQLHRMELSVMEHNHRAISLYRKCGFQSEGIKRHAIKIDGQFINEYLMAKLL